MFDETLYLSDRNSSLKNTKNSKKIKRLEF